MVADVVDDRRTFWRNFTRERIRVGLLKKMSLLAANPEFVRVTVLHSGDKPPPDPIAARIQPVLTMNPGILVT